MRGVGLFAMFSRAGPRGPSETVTERESGTVDRRRRRPTGPAAGATRGRRTGPPGRSACDPCSRALLGRAVVLNKRSPYGGEPPFLPNAQVCRGVGSGRPIGKRRDSATEAGPRRPFRVRWPLGRPQRPPAAPAPRRAAMAGAPALRPADRRSATPAGRAPARPAGRARPSRLPRGPCRRTRSEGVEDHRPVELRTVAPVTGAPAQVLSGAGDRMDHRTAAPVAAAVAKASTNLAVGLSHDAPAAYRPRGPRRARRTSRPA
jgi:hypothetical protein